MTTQHTPGPWRYSQGSVYKPEPTDADGYPTSAIARMDRENPDTFGAERDANARLIAAAPDLLHALETYVDLDHGRLLHGPQIHEDALSAIAKAKGESHG